MLIVEAHNDGTGSNDSANYNVRVKVNRDVIATLRVEGHNRDDGWRALLHQIADTPDIVQHWLDDAICPHCGQPLSHEGRRVWCKRCTDSGAYDEIGR